MKKLGSALQKIALEEIAGGLADLHRLQADDLENAAHDIRKRTKKLRALVRLVEDGLNPAAWKVENACFRDVGRMLGKLRDAHVLINALEKIRKRYFDRTHPVLTGHTRRLLAARVLRCEAQIVKEDSLGKMMAALESARARAARWNLKNFTWKDARKALRRSYKAARAAARKAAADPTMRRLHQWRKETKQLWYQVRLLRRACPAYLDEFAHDLKVLGEFLGDDHDLAVLREELGGFRDVLKRPPEFAAFVKLLELRRSELISIAHDLGETLFHEPAREFITALDEHREQHRRAKRKGRELAGAMH